MDIAQIVEEVESLTEEIAIAKEEKARAEGTLSEHLKTLHSLGIKSVPAGDKKLKSLTVELEKLEEDIIEQYEQLKEKYEW